MATVTLKDVAERAGVSVSLVSKVITGKMGNSTVSDEKAQKILAIAREMGYVPNVSARRLRTGKGKTIAAVLPYGKYYFNTVYYAFMDGILDYARDSEYEFVTVFYFWERKELESLRRVRNMSIDGLIYYPSYFAEESEVCRNAVEDIVRSGIPTIVSGVKFPRIEGCHYFDLDEKSGGYNITKYCISQGKKRIMLVKSFDEKRNMGYEEAMAEAGLSTEGLINEKYPYFERSSGYNFFTELCQTTKEEDMPEAIIATCDLCATGILDAMRAQGISKDRVMVVGIDGLESVASIYTDEFATVRQPTYTMGRDAAEAMVRFIETGEIEDRRYYQEEIVRT